jgi:glycosyltransferase involved in cell wall biosynthesis
MKQPLVTISIPTFNSEKFLERCLHAIQEQTYRNIEVNIIDGNSKDATLIIAKKFNVSKVKTYTHALLGARAEGVALAKGEYTLLLDSDQILEPDAIERAVSLAQNKKFTMLVLEEDVYKDHNLIEKLFKLDRKLIHSVKDFSPYTGVMMPRFYQTDLLKKAFKQIPEEEKKLVGGQDHAIIYHEAWKISNNVGLLSLAVRHIEPDNYPVIWKKFYRWGYTSVNAHYGKYEELLTKKERFRKGLFKKGLMKESFASITLLLLKGVPYKLGYYMGKLRSK